MVLSKEKLQKLNRYMLGLGAPIERDNIGYSRPDFGLMEGLGRFVNDLDDEMTFAVVERLNHYKNTQLEGMAEDIEDTYEHYKDITNRKAPKNFRNISEDYGVRDFLPYKVHLLQELDDSVALTFEGKLFLPNVDMPYWAEIHWKDANYKELLVPKRRLVDFMNRIRDAGRYGFEADEKLKDYMTFLGKQGEKPVNTIHVCGKTETGYYVRFDSFADIKEFMEKENSINKNCLAWKRVGDKIVLNVKRDELFYLYNEVRKLGFYNAQLEEKIKNAKLLTDKERMPKENNVMINGKYVELPSASGNKLVDWKQFDLPFTPYDFQIEDAKRIVERKRMLMGQDMGCGKSFIATLVGTSLNCPKLAIVPESLRLNWRKEIRNVTPNANIRILYSNEKFDITSNNMPDWTIVGYKTVTKYAEELKALGYKCVFIDEAHNCKAVNNKGLPASKRAEVVLDICNKAEYVYPMTGTPIPTRNKDLFNIFKMLKMEKIGDIPLEGKWSFFKYGQEYCDGHNNGFGWSFEGNTNSDKLHACLNPFMVRRLKKDVLPNLTKQRIFVATESTSKEYKDIEYRLHHMGNVKGHENDTYMGLAMTGRSVLSKEKVKPAIDLAESLLEEDKSVVIVSDFNETLDTIQKKFGNDCCCIRGGMGDAAKQKAIEDFQSGKKRVCALNIIAGGVGVTLTKASDMVICDYDWTPSNMAQVEDRICRSGQTENCNIHYIYCENSILDTTFVNMITEKSANIDKVVDGSSNTMDMNAGVSFMQRLQNILSVDKDNEKDNIDMSRFETEFMPKILENHSVEQAKGGYLIDGVLVRNRDLSKCMNFKKDSTVLRKIDELTAYELSKKQSNISAENDVSHEEQKALEPESDDIERE